MEITHSDIKRPVFIISKTRCSLKLPNIKDEERLIKFAEEIYDKTINDLTQTLRGRFYKNDNGFFISLNMGNPPKTRFFKMFEEKL